MACLSDLIRHVLQFVLLLRVLGVDSGHFWRLCLCSLAALAPGTLFLRKQSAMDHERYDNPRRATNATRFVLEVISEDDRSPPVTGPPCPHAPFSTTCATPVDTFDLGLAVGTSGWWTRASMRSRGARSLSKSALQAAPWRRAADHTSRRRLLSRTGEKKVV